MKINVNGRKETLSHEMTITEFLQTKGKKPEKVVVEYNESLIDRADWSETVLQENDRLEVLNFVGGG